MLLIDVKRKKNTTKFPSNVCFPIKIMTKSQTTDYLKSFKWSSLVLLQYSDTTNHTHSHTVNTHICVMSLMTDTPAVIPLFKMPDIFHQCQVVGDKCDVTSTTRSASKQSSITVRASHSFKGVAWVQSFWSSLWSTSHRCFTLKLRWSPAMWSGQSISVCITEDIRVKWNKRTFAFCPIHIVAPEFFLACLQFLWLKSSLSVWNSSVKSSHDKGSDWSPSPSPCSPLPPQPWSAYIAASGWVAAPLWLDGEWKKKMDKTVRMKEILSSFLLWFL